MTPGTMHIARTQAPTSRRERRLLNGEWDDGDEGADDGC